MAPTPAERANLRARLQTRIKALKGRRTVDHPVFVSAKSNSDVARLREEEQLNFAAAKSFAEMCGDELVDVRFKKDIK